jgi:hypothetical protein
LRGLRAAIIRFLGARAPESKKPRASIPPMLPNPMMATLPSNARIP